jgi:excisionase family DNA binding protein
MKRRVPPTIDERALVTTVNGAVAMLGSCRDKVYELIRDREIDSYLDGAARRITVASIKGYIERKLAASDTFERARYPQRGSEHTP